MKENKSVLLIGNPHIIHLIRWADFLKKLKYDVTIFTWNKNKFKNHSKIKFTDYSSTKSGILKIVNIFFNILKMIIIINKSNFRYVNFHYIDIFTCIVSIFIKRKIILTCLGSDILRNYNNSGFIFRSIFNAAFNKAEYITCDSEEVRTKIIDKNTNINAEKIKIIYWGIDTKVFNPPDKKEKILLRKKYNISNDSLVLLSIRNLTPLYNIIKIIDWFNKISADSGDKKILLIIKKPPVSNNKYINKCRNKAENNKNILFLEDTIKYENINELYKISDFSLHFPDKDATPVSMIEGIASGNLILCNEKIKSYNFLSKHFNLILTNLDNISAEKIINIYNNKKEKDNSLIIKKYFSIETTLTELKKIFI